MAPAVNEPVEGVSYRKKTTRYSKKLGKYAKKAAIDSGIIVHDLTELAVPEGVKSLVATEGRDEAIRECRRKVEKISKECRADNIKYRDPHFDLRLQQDYCLNGLKQTGENVEGVATPATAKRVGDIYDDPKFIVDGIDANDIKQGSAGDCWFLAAIATIANMPSLLDNICVARDEKVGVYGFIFFRDGEWVSEIVDDQLYISYGPYVDASPAVKSAFPTEKLYIEAKQRGSKALHFASCADSNETWLPLLEKAFAKAHGDYTAIEGGFTGEGVEDLTGGVTTELRTEDILDRDEFWTNDLLKVNDELLFAGSIHGVEADVVNGIMARHAYSILRAVEIDGERLVQVRNPWGQSEWTGPWSDGSKEWTAEWLTALDHKFGDDGSFWMTYADFLRTFSKIDRTRIFSSEWTIAQAWTLAEAQWPAAFSDRVFRITLTEASPVVIVLQQVDTRYFVGLEGQYDFELHFRIKRAGESEYVARTRNISGMSRSVTKELELEAGTWDVSFRVARIKRHAPRSAYISAFRKDQSDKFIHIARSFDYAFAKGLAYAVEEEEVEEEEVEEVEEEAEPAGDEDKGVEQAEEEEQQQEEQPQQQQQEEEDPSEQDTVAVVGLRVHALDRDVQVQIIQLEEPDTTLDPDASCVHSFLESSADKSGFLSSHIGSSRNLA